MIPYFKIHVGFLKIRCEQLGLMACDKKLPQMKTGLTDADLHVEWYRHLLSLLISGLQDLM